MRFLIDGYNLLFTLGLVNPHVGPKALEKARRELLDWLHRTNGARVADVTVIFDGVVGPPRPTDPVRDVGLHVRFTAGQSADDLIEEIIRNDTNPRKLTVVSSDHRIQQAGKRRGCPAWDSSEYIDWAMEQGDASPPRPRRRVKPLAPSPEETAQWLDEFKDVGEDTDLKEFNRPFEDFHDLES